MDLPTEDYDTLSGFVIGQLGRIPDDGDSQVLNLTVLFLRWIKLMKRGGKVKVCKT